MKALKIVRPKNLKTRFDLLAQVSGVLQRPHTGAPWVFDPHGHHSGLQSFDDDLDGRHYLVNFFLGHN